MFFLLFLEIGENNLLSKNYSLFRAFFFLNGFQWTTSKQSYKFLETTFNSHHQTNFMFLKVFSASFFF